ncbi:GNAT family N-acetyltransferase [Pedobacter agri]|uniref:GNAT family N-acetyltransferase n=1 Tax=Pedobacter agri TaxID=454586 RepID=UPI0029301EAC|nr:GNAT family N-acetyltransferase [Pedobacter agri]
MTQRGKGWVCEVEGEIVGFSIVDLKENNVWALFLRPEFENKGIGKELHRLTMDWYFSKTKQAVWLGTAPNTKAERFYELQGWKKVGMVNKGEVKFEMTYEDWVR